jgi:type II secretory ATPase GspE/PulE/Tfp pilus assembly ATPase PilB-like protein
MGTSDAIRLKLGPVPAGGLKSAAAAFPGLELLLGARRETVQALLCDGREVCGALTGFFATAAEVEITTSERAERIPFAHLQWLKSTVGVDPATSAEIFRRQGVGVESLPLRSPFTIRFTDGHAMEGELYGYGVALGGLGLYLANGSELATRMFVPASGIESFSVGERLGELLLKRGEITSSGLELALERQRLLHRQRIGNLLLDKALVTRSQLEQALALQAEHPVKMLGQVLVEMRILSPQQLEMALAAQQHNRRKPLGEILIELQMIDRDTLQVVLAQKLGIPRVDLKQYEFDANWGDLAPFTVCRDHEVIPLYRRAGAVIVATATPLDVESLNVVSFALGGAVVPVRASAEDIAWALEHHPERRLYDASATVSSEAGAHDPAESENAEALASRLNNEAEADAVPSAKEQIEASDSTLVQLVNKIIADAHRQKASDIHFEPGNGRDRLRVRFRRDGALFDYLSLPARFRQAIVSRIKIMANLDISEHRHALDGKIDFKRYGGLALELRVACVPTNNGLEAIVLRLLAAAKPMALADIGLAPDDLARLRLLSEKPYGLILVCGPTGSGKTTTLHSLLAHLNTTDTKIWTVEDPIEITQQGLTQVQTHAHIGWTFAAALRSLLRADPDIIMVGEIRDAETARIVVESSLTGHLVLSTLHTNSAAESVARLVDIGIDPFNFADALLGVLAQRLTRRLCVRCRRSEPAGEDEIHALGEEYCAGTSLRIAEVEAEWRRKYGVEGAIRLARPVGCSRCGGNGYAGRLALYELLVASPAIRRITLQRGTAEQLRTQAMAEGMRTLKQDGIEKVLQGVTTIEQVRAVSN